MSAHIMKAVPGVDVPASLEYVLPYDEATQKEIARWEKQQELYERDYAKRFEEVRILPFAVARAPAREERLTHSQNRTSSRFKTGPCPRSGPRARSSRRARGRTTTTLTTKFWSRMMELRQSTRNKRFFPEEPPAKGRTPRVRMENALVTRSLAALEDIFSRANHPVVDAPAWKLAAENPSRGVWLFLCKYREPPPRFVSSLPAGVRADALTGSAPWQPNSVGSTS